MVSSTDIIACPHCGTANRAQAAFCVSCGFSLSGAAKRTCPNCGAAVVTGESFCSHCGKMLPVGNNGVTPVVEAGRARGGGTGQLPPNTTLRDRYLVLRRIAVGGMGAVYEATDLINGKRWAVKEMSESSLLPDEREQAISDFQREATILRTLDQPNLPKVADLFNIGGRYYMVMEFVAGRTLQAVIDQTAAPLEWRRVHAIADQLCDVLDYLHSQRPPIIYRDLKPGNIMLVTDSRGKETVKLIDFGIARFHQPGKTRDTTTFGTAGYAPPEQYGRDQTDARSDIYALGATLHHLLTHRDPGLNPFNFGPIRDVNPSVPLVGEQAILKAVSTDAAARWPDVASFKRGMQGQPETKAANKPTKQQRPPAASGPLTSERRKREDVAAAAERALVRPRLVLSSSELDFGVVRPAEAKARRSDVGLVQRHMKVSLVNSGGGALVGRVQPNKPWLQADLDTFDTARGGNVRSIDVALRPERLPLVRKRMPIANVYRPLVRLVRRGVDNHNVRPLLLAAVAFCALLVVAGVFGGWVALALILGLILLPQLLVAWYAAHVYLYVPVAGEQVASLNIISNGGERAIKVRAKSIPTRWQQVRGYALLTTALTLEAASAALLIWQQLGGWLLPDPSVVLRSWFGG